MKILSDFDGVLTDITHEARRSSEIFRLHLTQSGGVPPDELENLLRKVQREMERFPLHHGWKVDGRIAAYWDEDAFMHTQALGACLDEWALVDRNCTAQVLQALKTKGISSFSDLAGVSYTQMTQETSEGKLKPLDPETKAVVTELLKRGHDVVIVSNSKTDRITQLLTNQGLAIGDSPNSQLRIRGDAKKFVLGDTPDRLDVDDHAVDIARPHYEAILIQERPQVVIGDVFSLDLALPLSLARRQTPGFEPLQLFLRKRDYTPSWVTHFLDKENRCERINNLSQLLTLIP